MRFALLAVASVLIVGCTTRAGHKGPDTVAVGKPRFLVFDNQGGYGHPGRRIELLEGGTLIETRYTDIVGDESVRHGTYQLGDAVLVLHFGDRGDQMLMPIVYDKVTYWVSPGETDRLKSDSRFRQISLKQQPLAK